MDQVPVCCQFMFQRVVRKEINGGVSGGGFVENAYVEVGWFSGYGEVEEVYGVCGFHSRLSVMLLWMVLMYCRMLSGLVRVES